MSYFINHSRARHVGSHVPTRAPLRQHPPIKVNKRLTIHPANGKVRKQKRARASSSASDVPASLPLIIKQTFSRLHVRDFAHAGPFRARCHDESSKILFRTLSAQDYDCFRVPSPRFQNLTRRRNCENVPIFRSRCLLLHVHRYFTKR